MNGSNLLSNKPNLLWIFLTGLLLVIVPILIIFDYMPSGYSLEEHSDKITIIENGILQNEHFTVSVTKESELKIALLKLAIHEFKNISLVNFLILSALFISLAINYKAKPEKKYLISMLIFAAIAILLSIKLYVSSVNYIEQLIEQIKILYSGGGL